MNTTTDLQDEKSIVEQFCGRHRIEFTAFFASYQSVYSKLLSSIILRINEKQSKDKGQPLIIGIAAPQGAGKTTLTQLFKFVLEKCNQLSVAYASIDDFYKTKSERNQLALKTHPLLKTRGVPGTHDINLAISVISQLKSGYASSPIAIPRFDKATDDRCDKDQWSIISKPIDVFLIEGWCLHAKAESEASLCRPINSLESEHDPQQIWRNYVNKQLKHHYDELFQLIDHTFKFYPPSYQCVCDWRKQQEQRLREKLAHFEHSNSSDGYQATTMTDQQVDYFMMHFERVTRHLYLSEALSKQTSTSQTTLLRLNHQRIPEFI